MEIVEVEKTFLANGELYSGSGYWKQDNFIPHGYGKKYYDGIFADVLGHFEDGILNGPCFINNGHIMHTIIFKNDRGNGWGMKIEKGVMTFGYYNDDKMVLNLTSSVNWIFEAMTEVPDNQIVHMYKKTGEIMIGYKRDGISGSYLEGFHFMTDGTVFVGTTSKLIKTGELIKFGNDGRISIGYFKEGVLDESWDLKSLIDIYIYAYYEPRVFLIDSYSYRQMFGDDFSPKLHIEKYYQKFASLSLDVNTDFLSIINNSDSVYDVFDDVRTKKVEITALQKTIMAGMNQDNVLIHNLSADIFPIKNIEVGFIHNDRSEYVGMKRNCMPYGYGYFSDDNTMRCFFGTFPVHVGDKFFSEDLDFIMKKTYKAITVTFYNKYVYIGEMISRASWKGNDKFTTSRYGIAILDNGMYIGEFPAGYHMKLCIGHFYDINGNIYKGVWNLPIDITPNWEDDRGEMFPDCVK